MAGSNRLGIDDVELAEQYAQQIDASARSLHTIVTTVDGLSGKLLGIWHGPDAEQFHATWRRRHRPTLNGAHDDLDALAKTVRRNISDQINTSNTLDGHTTVPGSLPLPLPPGTSGNGGPGQGGNGHGGNGPNSAGGDGRDGSGGDDEPPNIDNVSTHLTDGIHDSLDGKTGEDDKGVPVDVSMQQSLYSHQFVGADGKVHTTVAGMDADASAQAAVSANATANEHLKFDKDGVEASAGVTAFAGGSASVAAGLSNRYGSLKGDAGVTAGVQGEAEAKVGLTDKGLEAEVDGGGFVGAQAQAKGSVDVGGVGGSLGVHAYAGAGVHLGADADVNMHEVKIGVHVGAALGLGVGIDPSIDIHPDEVVHNATSLVKHVFGL